MSAAGPASVNKSLPIVCELIDSLVTAMMNARIYFSEHPRLQLSVNEVVEAVQGVLGERRDSTVRLAIAENYVLFEDRPVVGASLAAGRLINTLRACGSGGIELDAHAEPASVRMLINELSRRGAEDVGYQLINERLVAAGHGSVRLLPPFHTKERLLAPWMDRGDLLAAGESELGIDSQTGGTIELPTHLCQRVMDLLQDVTLSVCQGGRIDFSSVFSEAERLLQGLANGAGPLVGLSNRQGYDAFTLGHSMRVAVLAMNLARSLTTDSGAVVRVGAAALLHDVGKSMVPFEILHSRRPLTAEERDIIGTHPELGAEILQDHDEVDSLAVAAAFGHHRYLNGSGYPRTLHEYRQSTVTRIVKICDVYEALTAERPYKPPMSPIRAYRIMLSMRGHFDARLLWHFIHHNGIYATGSAVRLDNAQLALVLGQTQDRLSPRVLLVTDPEGNHLPVADRRTLDLSDPAVGRHVHCAESDPTVLEADSGPLVLPPEVLYGACGLRGHAVDPDEAERSGVDSGVEAAG